MTSPTYNQLANPLNTGPGLSSQITEERLLSVMAMLASGQNPDGSPLAGSGGSIDSTLNGKIITDNCFTTASSIGQTTTGTSEMPHDVLCNATDIRFVYTNHFYSGSADVDNANPITIKAAARIGSTIYPLTFEGQLSATISGGGMVQSDPLPQDVLAGSVIFSRTEVTPTTNWYSNHTSQFTPGMGGWTVTTGLCVAGAATITETAVSVMYVPAAIIGRATASSLVSPVSPRICLITGDSLAAGSNDYSSSQVGRNNTTPNLSGGGYITRALFNASIPIINSAASGDQAAFFVGVNGHNRRWMWASEATSVICEYGRNDISNSQTLAQVQANLITVWTSCAMRGQRVFQTTVTPLTSSTDGWITTTNQSFVSAQNTVRVNLNNWLRAGAPLTSAASLTPVAVGTSGALLSGSSGHPLYAVFDASSVAESSTDSGLWTTLSTGRTVTDATIALNASILISATANWQTPGDLGSLVTVEGAGTAGANLTATIVGFTNSTHVTLSTTAITAVTSGGTAVIETAATKDGLHPSKTLATLMSASVNTSLII